MYVCFKLINWFFCLGGQINIREIAEIGYTRRVPGQNWVPYTTIKIFQRGPEPGRSSAGCTRFWLLTPHRLPNFDTPTR